MLLDGPPANEPPGAPAASYYGQLDTRQASGLGVYLSAIYFLPCIQLTDDCLYRRRLDECRVRLLPANAREQRFTETDCKLLGYI